MDTTEYYGGLYPDPPIEKDEIEYDYNDYIADVIYEEERLNDYE